MRHSPRASAWRTDIRALPAGRSCSTRRRTHFSEQREWQHWRSNRGAASRQSAARDPLNNGFGRPWLPMRPTAARVTARSRSSTQRRAARRGALDVSGGVSRESDESRCGDNPWIDRWCAGDGAGHQVTGRRPGGFSGGARRRQCRAGARATRRRRTRGARPLQSDRRHQPWNGLSRTRQQSSHGPECFSTGAHAQRARRGSTRRPHSRVRSADDGVLFHAVNGRYLRSPCSTRRSTWRRRSARAQPATSPATQHSAAGPISTS